MWWQLHLWCIANRCWQKHLRCVSLTVCLSLWWKKLLIICICEMSFFWWFLSYDDGCCGQICFGSQKVLSVLLGFWMAIIWIRLFQRLLLGLWLSNFWGLWWGWVIRLVRFWSMQDKQMQQQYAHVQSPLFFYILDCAAFIICFVAFILLQSKSFKFKNDGEIRSFSHERWSNVLMIFKAWSSKSLKERWVFSEWWIVFALLHKTWSWDHPDEIQSMARGMQVTRIPWTVLRH